MTFDFGSLDLQAKLKENFGFSTFRAGQRELIEAVLSGGDALGVLPTAGGKSLTYQLPATLLGGLTVVVSPLIALMKDQVDAFNRRGEAPAVALHSNLSSAEAAKALAQVRSGRVALLYIAPERLDLPGQRERMLELKPKLLVIDEAHCVSQWGHDFRPSYLALRQIIAALRPCPVLALTATATPAARKDIAASLGLEQAAVVVAPFDRPNLRFEVHSCGPGEKQRRLHRILKGIAGQGSQIVYVGRRKDADEIAADLCQERLAAVAYHAGMSGQARRVAQDAWLAGRKPIAVATVAFGMGIDKPDVRAVIHYQHPASLEAYYQEAGRAGRDGAPARCITLFSPKDASLTHFFIRNRYPSRDQVLSVLAAISPGGTRPDSLLAVLAGMSEEQINVALLALFDQRRIWRNEDGNLRREDRDPTAARLSLRAMAARKDADYRRLEAVIAYCKEGICHRACLLQYFGETTPRDYRCGNCSACLGGAVRPRGKAAQAEVDRLVQAHRAILESAGPVSTRTFALFLGGSASKRVPVQWRELDGYGALAHIPTEELHVLAAGALNRGKRQPAGSENGRPYFRRAVATDQDAQSPVLTGDSEEGTVFWRSRDRLFTLQQLQNTEVPRRRGMSVLELVAENEGKLPPSGVANVLRGLRSSSVVKAHPDLLNSKQFGIEKGKKYEDLLPDVLAMIAKGYLRYDNENTKRLVLTAKARTIVGRK